MQNAKDTFFQVLQSRLAALNPARTIVVRGLMRPGVLVSENELPMTAVTTDAFRLAWSAMHVDTAHAMPLITLECAIEYATDGTTGAAGMDRGRALAAMDGELVAALGAPHSALKMNYAGVTAGTQPIAMATRIGWGDPVFAPVKVAGERLTRSVMVQVMAYQEAGEL